MPGQGQGQPMPGQGQGLGTGLVPNAPQVTAQQIAGQQANAAAAAAMAAAAQAAQSQGQGQPMPGQSQQPMPGAAQTATKGGAVKGAPTQNPDQQKGELQTEAAAEADSRGNLANQDAAGGGLKLKDEPWFAKLPPSLQAAIQAKARGKAPRGYEERLRRYFESVD
jgi:hypothetical protein